jgi:hypothetical protein
MFSRSKASSQRNLRRGFFIPKTFLAIALSTGGLGFLNSCAAPLDVFATRPKQLLSDSKAALSAAEDAEAKSLAAGYYRRAREHFMAGRRAYGEKNFGDAKRHLKASKKYSEEAEYQALRKAEQGGGGFSF